MWNGREDILRSERNAGEAPAAEILDLLDAHPQIAVGHERRIVRAEAEAHRAAGRGLRVAGGQRDLLVADLRLCAVDLGIDEVHAGRADEIADKSMVRSLEQL